MRTFFPVSAVLLVVLWAGGAYGEAPGRAQSSAAGPNLLLVTVDTSCGPITWGAYGGSIAPTPSIDGLAAGVLFERAFSHAPLTLPAHASILLGLLPPVHGVHDNSNFRVPDGLLTLAEWLKGRGYDTGAVVGAFPLDSDSA